MRLWLDSVRKVDEFDGYTSVKKLDIGEFFFHFFRVENLPLTVLDEKDRNVVSD